MWALQGFIASFSSFFSAYMFTVLHHSHHSQEVLFGCNRQLFSSNKPEKNEHYLLSTTWQTDAAND